MKNKIIEKPRNDVIYIRVSSDEQVKGFSLENQDKFCREASKKAGHDVIMLFRDDGESAKTTTRPGLQKMLRFCEQNKKKIRRVVVYKLDRLSRSMQDHVYLEVYLNKLGIELVSATENIQNTPSGKLHKHILAAFSQFDNDVRSQRTSEGMKARLLKGLWSGIAPWGYINDKDKLGNKIITPHPEKAPIVKKLFQDYATGKYSFKELADMANKLGHKSRHGMKMSKQLVAKIIRNPIYCGKVVVPKFGISTQGSHGAIISEKLFNEANSENKGVAGRKLARNKDSPDYPLRGVQCSGCGGNMSGGKTKGKTKYYQYYGCIKSSCEKRRAVKKEDLEDDFTDFLRELTPNDEFFDILKESIRLAHKAELISVETAEKKLNSKITELKSEKDELLNMRIKGKILDDDFAPANEAYKVKILELEKELASLSNPELEVDNLIESGVEFLKNLPDNWKGLDVKDLRVLRNLLFPQNLIYQYPTIKTLELACIYKLKSKSNNEKNRLVTLRGIEPRLPA